MVFSSIWYRVTNPMDFELRRARHAWSFCWHLYLEVKVSQPDAFRHTFMLRLGWLYINAPETNSLVSNFPHCLSHTASPIMSFAFHPPLRHPLRPQKPSYSTCSSAGRYNTYSKDRSYEIYTSFARFYIALSSLYWPPHHSREFLYLILPCPLSNLLKVPSLSLLFSSPHPSLHTPLLLDPSQQRRNPDPYKYQRNQLESMIHAAVLL